MGGGEENVFLRGKYSLMHPVAPPLRTLTIMQWSISILYPHSSRLGEDYRHLILT